LEWEREEYDLFEKQAEQCLTQMRQICEAQSKGKTKVVLRSLKVRREFIEERYKFFSLILNVNDIRYFNVIF
jgi:hypothetical protein